MKCYMQYAEFYSIISYNMNVEILTLQLYDAYKVKRFINQSNCYEALCRRIESLCRKSNKKGDKMRKKLIGVMMSVAMAASVLTGALPAYAGETEAAEEVNLEGKKVGLSFMNAADPVIAELLTRVRATFDPMGIDVLVADAGGDASKQMDDVENFINSDCDVIVIQALDATAMSDEAKKAMDKGIKVIAYGIGIDNYDTWYKTDNALVGDKIGEMAGNWINEQLDGKAKVELIDYPTVEVLIERADHIKSKIEELCPDVEFVSTVSAIDSESGYSQTETVLAANPDLNCIVSISDGPAVGAYEAAKEAGLEGDNFGVFGSDLSNVALQYIADDTSYRGSTDIDIKVGGDRIAEIATNLMTGKEQEKDVVMNVTPVTIDNVADYLEPETEAE